MTITIETDRGPREAWVCDYCRCSFIQRPHGFCSGRCSRSYYEMKRIQREVRESKAESK